MFSKSSSAHLIDEIKQWQWVVMVWFQRRPMESNQNKRMYVPTASCSILLLYRSTDTDTSFRSLYSTAVPVVDRASKTAPEGVLCAICYMPYQVLLALYTTAYIQQYTGILYKLRKPRRAAPTHSAVSCQLPGVPGSNTPPTPQQQQ